jgi:hypothetical protein
MTTHKIWRAVGVSSQGGSHLKTGDPCQDAHCWRVLPCGTMVVAVADGAGTAALAEIGAGLAVTTAMETVCRKLTDMEASDGAGPSGRTDEEWRDLLAGGLAAALRAVEGEAAARQARLRDFACTLAVAVARPGRMVAAIQIGDGAVVARADGGGTFAVTRPAPSEYLNETTFLVSPGAIGGAAFTVWRGDLACLAALTDGLQMLALKMPGGDPHQGFFEPLFRFVAATGDPVAAGAGLRGFLDSPRVRERADDDLTLFLAVCGP